MNDFVEVHYIFRTIRRWWWVLIMTTLLAILAGYIYSKRQTEIYRATTSLIVGATIQATNLDRYDFQISQELARTYADIAQRQPVMQAVVDALEVEQSWRTLRSQVKVENVDTTQLLEIRAEAASPEQAVLIADEVARQLILLSPTSLGNQSNDETDEFVQDRLERLKKNVEAGQLEMDALERSIPGLVSRGAPPERLNQLQDEIETLETLVTTWESTYARLYNSLRSNPSTNYLTIIEPAQLSTNPIRPNTKLNLLVSAIVGFALGLGLVFLLEYTDNSFRSIHEVTEMLRLASLGAISHIPSDHAEDLLVTNQDAFSTIAEDCRMLRSKLLFLSKEWPRKVILVTSPAQGEGKSLIVANLGIAMAHIGLKTVIVDANLRKPIQHELFHLPQTDGLIEELQSSSPSCLAERLKKSPIPDLFLLTSGNLSLASPDRLGTANMTEILESLAREYDIILCDAPEAVKFADTLMLANQANGVLFIVDADHTHRTTALQAVQNLQQTEADLLGFVLNRASTQDRTTSVSQRQSHVNVDTVSAGTIQAEI